MNLYDYQPLYTVQNLTINYTKPPFKSDYVFKAFDTKKNKAIAAKCIKFDNLDEAKKLLLL